MIALATPVAITQLAQILLGFTDTVMVGRIGPDALASIALGNSTFFALVIFGIGTMNGVSPMVSQAFGEGDADGVGDGQERRHRQEEGLRVQEDGQRDEEGRQQQVDGVL